MIKLERLADAKSVFDQAKGNGAKGDDFDQLEQKLRALNEAPTKAGPMTREVEQSQSNILDTLKLDQATKLAKKKFRLKKAD